MLVVVADGVGHGPAAAIAARAAVDFIVGASSRDLAAVLADCDRAILRTRGAAVAVLRITLSTGRVAFAGVGNVEVAALTAERARLVGIPGIVGARMRRASPSHYRAWPGDFLVVHTDGIARHFNPETFRNLEPQDAATRILESHARAHDDATCVVLRF